MRGRNLFIFAGSFDTRMCLERSDRRASGECGNSRVRAIRMAPALLTGANAAAQRTTRRPRRVRKSSECDGTALAHLRPSSSDPVQQHPSAEQNSVEQQNLRDGKVLVWFAGIEIGRAHV